MIGKKKTLNEFIKDAIQVHGDLYNYDKVEYKNAHTKVEIYCKKCKNYFWQTPGNHLHGQGCKKCGHDKTKEKEISLKRHSNEWFIEKAKFVHKDRYDYTEINYINKRTEIKLKCNNCNNVFYQTPEHHLKGHGCPICRKSRGENKIKNWLIDNNIEYISQHWFKNCRDKNPLPFDFYLPKYNLCIEFQGKQHYYEGFFSLYNKKKETSKLAFKRLKHHDQIKREYCKQNNIGLLEIKYWENIENKLTKYIKKE